MPTISLRLTEQEHAALKDWALGSHRSMQREAVYRIFTQDRAQVVTRSSQTSGWDSNVSSPAGDEKPQASRVQIPSPAPDDHFKPDFK